MATYRRFTVGVAAILVLGAGGTAFYAARHRAAAAPLSSASGVSSANAAEHQRWLRPSGANRTAGGGLAYSVDFHVSSSQGEAESAQDFASSMRLRLYEVGRESLGTRWVGMVDQVTGAVDALLDRSDTELTRAMEARFTFVASSSGEVVGIGFPDGTDQGGRTVARSIVAALQFQRLEPNANAWQAKETNAFGPCAARYQRRDAARYEKQLSDCALAALNSVVGVEPVIRSSAEYEFDGSIVTKLRSTDSLTLAIGGENELVLRTRVSLSHLGPAAGPNPCPDSDTWRLEGLAAPAIDRDAPAASPDRQLADKRALLDGARFSDLSTIVDRALAAADEGARMQGFARLSALFELEPESIGLATRELRGPIGSNKAETIVAALSNSKSDVAQSAMRELALDPGVAPDVKGHVFTHLGLHEAPSAETLDALEGVAQDGESPAVRMQAALALGGAVHHAGSNEATREEADRKAEWLNDAYRKATDPGERNALLAALGNAGAPSSLDAIERALQSPEAGVRADAVFALRFIQGEHADRLIAAVLLRDPETKVRRAAAETFGYRELSPSLEEAALSAYRGDSTSTVRHGVITFLCAKSPRLGPKAVEALKLATADEDESVRASAVAALALLRAS